MQNLFSLTVFFRLQGIKIHIADKKNTAVCWNINRLVFDSLRPVTWIMHKHRKHINQDSTLKWNKIVTRQKINTKTNGPVEPRWARPTTEHQAPTNFIECFKLEPSLSLRPARRRANKEGIKVVNSDWVKHQACSLWHSIPGWRVCTKTMSWVYELSLWAEAMRWVSEVSGWVASFFL